MKFVMRMDGRLAAFAARLERSFVRYQLMESFGRTIQETPHRSTRNLRLFPPTILFLLLALNPSSPRTLSTRLHFSVDPPDNYRSKTNSVGHARV